VGRAAGCALGAIVLLSGGSARAVDPFEIQVYDGTADRRGQAGLEVHANTIVEGLRTTTPPELPAHRTSHLTFEPSYGLRDFWEVGAYLQTALRPEGDFDFAGVKLRTKLVTPPGWSASRARLGVNVELSYIPAAYDASRWGGEVPPIIAWESERAMVAVNPIVGLPPGGGTFGLEPCATAVFKLPRLVSVGLEYYADLGPLTRPARWLDQQHYVYEVVNLLAFARWELNVGLGQGLTPVSQPLVAKLIVGWATP
jgi:hypothetical protein